MVRALKKPLNKGLISILVEMRGIEPLSKNSPTLRRLQFSFSLSKTIEWSKANRY